MQKISENPEAQPPAGYPTAEAPEPGKEKKKKKLLPSFGTKQKGDRGFIEGCLFALCCCWICEMCC
ncbi:PREDICTED: cysteine-rich and transmembrane domain-containing protein A [Tarenaya hassleriana]|uniref:cysteine-rich and transmembrane domain-containing protein A n=1 Tax=Tarenaya hassleriana TaxID=28532 RepID=UPI00053C80A7|nr:PREDICTED: cysteine-rich and transmembrane domain-containing protein A [Tarenaya hassleriana]